MGGGARADSRLSHPNAACADAVAVYSLAVAHLVLTPGDRSGAVASARAWARTSAVPEVAGWLEDAEAFRLPPCHPQAGFIRIAFTHAFAHLCRGTGYIEALRATLLGGGDTDTNACIVGGLIGAAVGEQGIPGAMREAVLTADTALGQPRPEWLHPRQIPGLMAGVVESAYG